MEILHDKQMFYIGETPETAMAKMTYEELEDGTISIDQTWVSETLAGQGVAKKLLAALVAWAREEDIKVRATCSFAVKQFEKSEEYADVLAR